MRHAKECYSRECYKPESGMIHLEGSSLGDRANSCFKVHCEMNSRGTTPLYGSSYTVQIWLISQPPQGFPIVGLEGVCLAWIVLEVQQPRRPELSELLIGGHGIPPQYLTQERSQTPQRFKNTCAQVQSCRAFPDPYPKILEIRTSGILFIRQSRRRVP